MTQGGAVEARRAHNPKVLGSNPSPATNYLQKLASLMLMRPLQEFLLCGFPFCYGNSQFYNRFIEKYVYPVGTKELPSNVSRRPLVAIVEHMSRYDMMSNSGCLFFQGGINGDSVYRELDGVQDIL